MIALLDSSIILRLVLRQPDPLATWPAVQHGIANRLAEVECLRTLDRVRLRERLSDETMIELHEDLHSLLRQIEIVELSPATLARAGHPFPTSVGTLDAIHLATALLWREETGDDLVLATHDRAMAQAARAFGFPIVGV